MTCARPARVRVELTENHELYYAAGLPKAAAQPQFSFKTPVKKGSTPSSSKYCLVGGIIIRIESFYALSRPELLSALNAILRTTVQLPLVKDDQRQVCKSCFRRLELIKNKKSVMEALEKEFQARYTSTVVKNRETTANIKRLAKDSPQDRRSKRICVISNLDANDREKTVQEPFYSPATVAKRKRTLAAFLLNTRKRKKTHFLGTLVQRRVKTLVKTNQT